MARSIPTDGRGQRKAHCGRGEYIVKETKDTRYENTTLKSPVSPKAPKVSVFPADRGGTGWYRLLFVAGALQQQGFPVLVDSPKIDAKWLGKELVGVLPLKDVDVMVFQRPLKRAIRDAIPFIQEQGIAVVIEIDDDFTSIDANNPAFISSHPKRNPDHNWHLLLDAIRMADMLTVSTPALARKHNHPNTVVLENCIPNAYVEMGKAKTEHDPLIVGWGGSPETHPGDLEQMGQLSLGDAWFMALGGRRTREVLNVDRSRSIYVPWTKSIEDYASVLTQIDIGLAPLIDTTFNHSKSFLKSLEMSALGVPHIASPLPEYLKLGTAMLARRPKDWARSLKSLLVNGSLRQELREKGLERAAEFTYEKRAHLWWEAWTQAYEMRQAA